MAEGARLESVFTRKGNVGSNPTLSASIFGLKGPSVPSSVPTESCRTSEPHIPPVLLPEEMVPSRFHSGDGMERIASCNFTKYIVPWSAARPAGSNKT